MSWQSNINLRIFFSYVCLIFFCFSAVYLYYIMRRKRASTNLHQGHQTNIINVHAVVLGLDGVGKSGGLIYTLAL